MHIEKKKQNIKCHFIAKFLNNPTYKFTYDHYLQYQHFFYMDIFLYEEKCKIVRCNHMKKGDRIFILLYSLCFCLQLAKLALFLYHIVFIPQRKIFPKFLLIVN